MSGTVVLRCPNCGTTKAAPGECEACHEAQVRYFCTNHKPGRWLDGPACPDCGARFGDPPRPTAAAPPRPASARPPSSGRPSAPATTTTTAPRRETRGGSPWFPSRAGRSPAPGGTSGPRAGSRIGGDALRARLPEILGRAGFGVRRPPRGMAPLPGELPDEVPPVAGPPALGGCLARALFLIVFLILAFLALSVLVGGSLFQDFGVYSW